MSEAYQVVSTGDMNDLPNSTEIAGLLAKDGQLILPLLDLVEQAQCAIDDLIDVMSRATIEAVLSMSAQHRAGPKQQGRKADRDVVVSRHAARPCRLEGAATGRDQAPAEKAKT